MLTITEAYELGSTGQHHVYCRRDSATIISNYSDVYCRCRTVSNSPSMMMSSSLDLATLLSHADSGLVLAHHKQPHCPSANLETVPVLTPSHFVPPPAKCIYGYHLPINLSSLRTYPQGRDLTIPPSAQPHFTWPIQRKRTSTNLSPSANREILRFFKCSFPRGRNDFGGLFATGAFRD